MSAAELRAAAALMRTRAEAASPAPWDTNPQPRHIYVEAADGTEVSGSYFAHSSGCESATADAEHIASWHPAVALAVADWLDAVAGRWQNTFTATDEGSKIIVARAYLGGDT